MSLLWKRLSEITVTKKLRLAKNAVLEFVDSTNTTNTVSLTELEVLDGITATTAEINTACDQSVQVMTPGAGVTDGTGTLYHSSIVKEGTIFKTTIFCDITGLQTSTTDLDVVGSGVSGAHFGQITAALNGTLFFGQVTWLETPATGADDLVFYFADEATGAFDSAITALTNDTVMYNKGSAAAGDYATPIALTTLPGANKYLYLVNGEAGTVGTFTAGQFILELWGV